MKSISASFSFAVALALSSFNTVKADELPFFVSIDGSLSRETFIVSESINFRVAVSGADFDEIEIRWQKNGQLIDGANGRLLVLSKVKQVDTDVYRPVVVSGESTVATGQEFLLVVNKLALPSNLSSRFYVNEADGHAAVIGIVVPEGVPWRPVFIRGIGSTLSSYGVVDPGQLSSICIFDSSGEKVSEYFPGFDSEIDRERFARYEAYVGAFPSVSSDIRVVHRLMPGVYTIVAYGAKDSPGTVLVEVYFSDYGLN